MAKASNVVSLPVVATPVNTYEGLIQAVQLWADRDDSEFVAQIPNFIDWAQKEIFRTARWSFMEKEAYLMVSDGIAAVPSDYLQGNYMYFAKNALMMRETSLDEVSTALNTNYAVNSNALLSQVREVIFARMGQRFIFYPRIDADMPVQVAGVNVQVPENAVVFGYYADPQAFYQNDSKGAAEYLLTVAPDLLLNLALKQAAVFTSDVDAIQRFENEASKIFNQIDTQNKTMDFSASSKAVQTPYNQF